MAREPLDQEFIDAVIGVESSGNPNAVSPKGAEGLMQVMPATAAEIAEELGYESYDMKDPETNKVFGTHYLNKMLDKFENPSLALAAYNAGPGRVQQAIEKAQQMGRGTDFESIKDLLPSETQAYVPKIMSRYTGSPSPEIPETPVSSVRIDPSSVGMSEEEWEDTLAKAETIKAQRAIKNSVYPESTSLSPEQQLLDDGRPLKTTLSDLYNKTPEQRAQIGGVMGASTGLSVGGLAGSVIGAGVGSIAARSAGLVQSESYQIGKQNTEFVNTLSMIGLINKAGQVSIDLPDGNAKSLLNINEELPNTSSIYGEPTRTVFEKDVTNPFTARAENAAIPLAMLMLSMSQIAIKGGTAQKYAENVANFFTNAFVSDAKSMRDVYTNAQGVAEKLGVSKSDIKKFLKQNKNSFDKNKYKQYLEFTEEIYAR